MPLTTPGGAGGPGSSGFEPPVTTTDANGVDVPNPSQPVVNPLDALNVGGKQISIPVTRATGFGSFLHNMGAGMMGLPPTGDEGNNGKLTKFGMLARVLGPALQGGLIGLAGGKGHPGGGFGAAQDFYDRQRAYQMQKTLLERQQVNDQFRNLLEYARTQHTLNQPNFTGRGAAPIKGQDANGNPIYMRPNPQTGVYEPIEGITPDSNADYASSNTDQGIVLYDKHGTAPTKPLTLPNPTQSALTPSNASPLPVPTGSSSSGIPLGAPTGSIQPSESDSGSPRLARNPVTGVVSRTGPFDEIPRGTASQSPGGINAIPRTAPRTAAGAVSGSAIPLMPPDRHTDTLKEKAADALKAKHPDWTDDQIYAAVEAAGRKPDKDDSDMSPKEYRRRFQQLSTQLNSDFGKIEDDRKKKLAALAKQDAGTSATGTLTPEQVEEQRQGIEEETADAKQTTHRRAIDNATAQGIDLGTVPDYRAQLTNGGSGSASSTENQPAARAATPKTGDVKNYRGIPFRFDGKQWVRSKS